MATKIFLNLPVNDLERSKAFFSSLGFTFNPQFSNEDAACLILGDNIFSMLITEPFFKTFHKKEVSDTAKGTEVHIAIDVPTRNEVDRMIENAMKAGGKEYREPMDEGWMFSRAFEDLDGHMWEIMYMDEKAIPQDVHTKE